MDLDDLGPAEETFPDPYQSHNDSPVRSTARKSNKSSKSLSKQASPFKSSKDNTDSVFKANKREDKSPFRSTAVNDSPFKSSSNKEKALFKSSERDSPFKASNKENTSPFKKSDNFSPFKAKTNDSSPFRAGDSPFKSTASRKPEKESSSSLFKASSLRSMSPVTDRSESRSVSKKKARKNKKDSRDSKKKESKKSDRKKKENDIFSSFGIQSVDDLFGQHSFSAKSVSDGDKSQVSDVISQVSEEIKTERVYRSVSYDDSATEVPSEIEEVRPSAQTYTDDFDSVSERIGYASDKGRSSASEVQTKYSGDETEESVTDYSDTETETRTYSRSVTDTQTYTDSRRDDKDDYSYTSYTEDFTRR